MDFFLVTRVILSLAMLLWVPILAKRVFPSLFSKNISAAVYVASVAGALSLLTEFSPFLSTLLKLPWLIFTLVIASQGLRLGWRSCEKPLFDKLHQFVIALGAAFLSIGGVWFFSLRNLDDFLGFSEPWKTLTAVHFHYASFCVPLAIALLLPKVKKIKPELYRSLSFCTFVYTVSALLIAIGINGHRKMELIGVTLIVFNGAKVLAVLLILQKKIFQSLLARRLFNVGALAGLISLTLALLYTWQLNAGLNIKSMVFSHGMINALLFVPFLVMSAVIEYDNSTDRKG